MTFEDGFWKPWGQLAFLTPEVWEYPVLGAFVLATLVLLIRSRRDFARLTWGRALLLLFLSLSPALTNSLWVPSFPTPALLPPPNVPVMPPAPFAPLLGALPVAVAGAWLGAGPALLVGLSVGVSRAFMTLSGLLDPFTFAFLAYLAGLFLRQGYRGRVAGIVRQPVAALPLATLLVLPVQFLAIFAHSFASGLAGLDYAVTTVQANLAPMLLQSLVAAVVVQAAYLVFPALQPVRIIRGFPPYTRTLGRHQLFLLMPLILLLTAAFVYTATKTTLRVATDAVVDEMARDANGVAEEIPEFIYAGQSLLEEFAADDRLWTGDPVEVEEYLQRDVRTLAFFDQLTLFDAAGEKVAMYPSPPSGDPELTREERDLLKRVLESGAPQISTVHRSGRGEVILTFLAPVERTGEAGAGEAPGALLGRTLITSNPTISRLLASLRRTRAGTAGFVIDADGRVVIHSEPSMLLTEWFAEDVRRFETQRQGWASEGRNPRDNTRQLVYYSPVEGYPWVVVMPLPYEVVLERARQVAAPLLLIYLLLAGAFVVLIPLVANRLTRRLKQLATSADHIAKGHLKEPVHVPGHDEVAQVGQAFERMRIRLRDRLEGLSLLLRISQAASATLDLSKGMASILEGALQAVNARVARIVFLSTEGAPQTVMGRGTPRNGLDMLDRALAAAVQEQWEPLCVEKLADADFLDDAGWLRGVIEAVIALPVCVKERVTAVMWVGYARAREFDASEVDLLTVLAGQAAVLVENARLFQAAEGGRRRLAAILDGASDAIFVTDRNDRILLINLAAERSLGVEREEVVGRKIDEVRLPGGLKAALVASLPSDGVLTREVRLADGRTLCVGVSAILSAEGEQTGRVSTMRDITRFKELDDTKLEFITTISQDLRTPLTFVRGYTTMLPLVGEVNGKQREYVEKILHGIDQMGALIDDLLNLGRIEAGTGLEHKPCHLGAILVEAVDGLRARASAKGLTLKLEPAGKMAVVEGDAAVLRQAVTNLVDNAVKYTPAGGTVTVSLFVDERAALIRVADTGIGIAPEDQVRLFEKFYRIKRRDPTDGTPGTGLGLAIVRSAIERHGGRVWVDSDLGRGSTFYVSLPLGGVGAEGEHPQRQAKG